MINYKDIPDKLIEFECGYELYRLFLKNDKLVLEFDKRIIFSLKVSYIVSIDNYSRYRNSCGVKIKTSSQEFIHELRDTGIYKFYDMIEIMRNVHSSYYNLEYNRECILQDIIYNK